MSKRNVFIISLLLSALLFSGNAYSFDKLGKKKSYLGSRYITLGLGLGFSSIIGFEGVSGDRGFGFDLSIGHEFNHYLSIDFNYKLSLAGLNTPNPLDISQTTNSTLIFNGEAIRLMYRYPAYCIQPFVYGGLGIYNFTSVDSKTGMDFPVGLQIPLGAGFLAYLYKNKLSFKTSFDWHVLFGENQNPTVLGVLGLNKVSFDLYSFMFAFTWHIF